MPEPVRETNGRSMKAILSSLAALTLVAGAAAAASVAHEPASESWTSIAGKEAPQTGSVLARSRYHALRGVKLWDYDRRSCVLEVEQSSLNTPSRAAAGTIRACEPRVAQSWKAADVGDGRVITALEVCTAEGESAAIRGMRLWGSGIDADGKVEKPSADVKVELTGCKKWSGKVACPAGQVATGIRARWGDAKDGIVGFELRCHALVREGGES
jgi:hypothetical protein